MLLHILLLGSSRLERGRLTAEGGLPAARLPLYLGVLGGAWGRRVVGVQLRGQPLSPRAPLGLLLLTLLSLFWPRWLLGLLLLYLFVFLLWLVTLPSPSPS